MTSAIYNIGLTALMSFQRSLDVTAQNIANASTRGYSRQSVLLSAIPGGRSPAGNIGAGVEVGAIRRNVDQFLLAERIFTGSGLGASRVLAKLATSLEHLVGPDGVDLQGAMTALSRSLEDVASDPTNLSARTEALSQGRALADRFQLMSHRLNNMRGEVSERLTATAEEINSLTSQVADLNERIAEQGSMGTPNDLLDQRDEAIRQLSELVDIEVVEAENGMTNISTAKGLSLVLGSLTSEIEVSRSQFDPSEIEVGINTGGNVLPIADSVSGGELGGYLSFVSDVLNPAQNEIGRQAIALGTLFNEQQARGLDLDGNLGSDFFAVGQPQVLASIKNSNPGSTATTVSIDDLGALTAADYELAFDGTDWTLTNLTTGADVPLVADGTDFVADGLRFSVDPAAGPGDRFLIRPTRGGARALDVVIDDPKRLAAASALLATPATGNAGTASISTVEVIDSANAALLDDVRIEFTDATTFTINGGAPQTYTPGEDIEFNGWRLSISGTPAAGDVFDVTANDDGAIGNGENALALAAVNRTGVLDGGQLSIFGAQTAFVGTVGSQARNFEIAESVQLGLMASVEGRLESVRGVNLDEEAIKLQQLQQSYNAAAEIFSVANEIFNTLLRSVGR